MNMITRPILARHDSGMITVQFHGGHSLKFPIKGNPRLENGTADDLNDIELSPFGIHWPKLDEDLSFEGIMRGDFGQKISG